MACYIEQVGGGLSLGPGIGCGEFSESVKESSREN
jgi:hypothetical protein